MNIDIILTPKEAEHSRLSGRAVAVIDVFRATSCICTAMENGAKRLIPLTSVEQSVNMRDRLLESGEKNILLGGERKMLRIDGFELDNSPASYKRELVEGSTIVMSTTNGTRSIQLASQNDAHCTLVASLLNATAAAEALHKEGRDITLFCSGRADRFSIEDTLCAGYMVWLLDQKHTVELTGVAWWAMDVYKRYADNLREAMQCNEHYHRLLDLNMADDVAYCLQRDILTSVPRIKDGVVTL